MMRTVHRQKLLVIEQSAVGVRFSVDQSSMACAGCTGCTVLASRLPGTLEQKTPTLAVDLPVSLVGVASEQPLQVGQSVDAEVPAEMLLVLSSVVYLLPIVLMLFFAISGSLLFSGSEARIAVSAAVGLTFGFGATILSGPALRSLILKHLTVRHGSDNPSPIEEYF